MSMRIGKIIGDVTPIGGQQKADAVKVAAKRSGVELANVMYVGDSITDVEAFKLVRDNGGLTLSFNGNQYAIRNAEIAIMSDSSLITTLVADLFAKSSKQEVMETVRNWNRKSLGASCASKFIVRKVLERHPTILPNVKIVTPENEKLLALESNEFRKRVRGVAIGKLG